MAASRIIERQHAEKLVIAGGESCLRALTGPLRSRQKDSNLSSVVTAADLQAEKLMVGMLHETFPEDGIVSEEGASDAGAGERRWLLDPLDGTLLFTRGLPGWTTSAVLLDADEPVVSAAYDPVIEKLWSADRHAGARLNGSRISTSSCKRLDQAILHMAFPSFRQKHVSEATIAFDLARAAGAGLAVGAPTSSLAYLAAGSIDAWVNINVEPWDWQPGRCLVLAAGGHTAEARHWKIAAATEELLEELLRHIAGQA